MPKTPPPYSPAVWLCPRAGFKSWNSAYRRSRGGFTLLEVLIAFAILAFAMTALMQAFSQGLRGQVAAEDYAAGIMLARSKMAEVGPIIPIAEGERTGELTNGWQWRVVVLPYGGEDDASVESDALHLYEVQVAIERNKAPLADLRSLRVGAAP